MKKKGQKVDFSKITERIESGIKAAEAFGLPVNKLSLDENLLNKVKDSGFESVKDVLKNVDLDQAANTAKTVFDNNKKLFEKGAKDFFNLFS